MNAPNEGGTDVPKPMTFEAVRLAPEGWVVLSPEIATVDGQWYRLHIVEYGHSTSSETWAKHTASELNRAATAAERERCLDWVMAYRRDCGCADLIADAIRAEDATQKET